MTLDHKELIDKMKEAFISEYYTKPMIEALVSGQIIREPESHLQECMEVVLTAVQDYIELCDPNGTDCIDADTLHELKTLGRK